MECYLLKHGVSAASLNEMFEDDVNIDAQIFAAIDEIEKEKMEQSIKH